MFIATGEGVFSDVQAQASFICFCAVAGVTTRFQDGLNLSNKIDRLLRVISDQWGYQRREKRADEQK